MKLIIVRHGQTEANVKDILQGRYNTPLTQEGFSQAERLAEFCLSEGISRIYSSPIKRALDTARIVSKNVHKEIETSDLLLEVCYGDWEGRQKETLKNLPEWKIRKKDKYNFMHPGSYNEIMGESYKSQLERFSFFLDNIKKRHSEETILIIGHLGTSRNARKYFENVSDNEAVEYSPKNNEAYIISTTNDETKIKTKEF